MAIPWNLETEHLFSKNNDQRRRTVMRADPIEQDSSGILLRTHAAFFTKPWGFETEGDCEGRIRIDILGENMLRVRYAEGRMVPEHVTPMLADLPNAVPFKLLRNDQQVDIKTNSMTVEVHLDPYQVKVLDSNGRCTAVIGGRPRGNNHDSYNTGLFQASDGKLAVEHFSLRPGEGIYGFGERFTNLNKVGQRVDLTASDTMSTSSLRAYKNVPFFVSTHGYGVFFNHSCQMSFWVGSLSACDVQAALDDSFLDYFVFTGSIKEILHTYTGLTGRGELPPRWSFGFWQSRFLSSPDILEMAEKLRANQIPADVLCLDADWMTVDFQVDLEFTPRLFPDPAKTMRELREKGFRVCAWQMPYVRGGSNLYNRLAAVDGLVRTRSGEPYPYGSEDFTGFVVDFTNPRAVEIYKEAIRQVLRAGVSVIKVDFGEAAPLDGIYYGGNTGKDIHNLYPMLYNQAIYDATREVTGEGLIWGRSTWAGSQRYPLHWGGDPQSNFENMITELEGGLSLGLSGFQFWSFDIGGFWGTPSEELFLRTLQMGLFVSHSRSHGTGNRELYNFSPETVTIGREYHNLRYRLLPYLYAEAKRCIEQSLPMARALLVDYQDDPTTWNIADQYLFGDSLMVAPILSEENTRLVYFPAGVWTDWWTGERIQGPQWKTVSADLKTLPIYLREGGMVVLGPVMQYVDQVRSDTYELRLSPFKEDGEWVTGLYDEGRWATLRYTAVQGYHRLEVEGLQKELKLQVSGGRRVELVRK